MKEEKKITCLDFATFAAICIMEDLQYELPDEFLSLSQLQAKSYHELDEFFHVWMLQPSTSHKKAKFGANVSIHQLFKMLSNLRGGSKRPNNGQFLERTRQTKTKNWRSAGAVYFLIKQHFSSKCGGAERIV